jgi:hypothetical protein
MLQLSELFLDCDTLVDDGGEKGKMSSEAEESLLTEWSLLMVWLFRLNGDNLLTSARPLA